MEHVAECRSRNRPDDDHEARGHQGDEHPPGHMIELMISSSPPRAAIYTRISQAADDVDKTANQEEELRALAASSGYAVVEVFEDDDISAYRGKKVRPSYVAMLAGLRESRFDVVLATEPSRLTRGSAAELEALNMELVRANAVIHTARAGIQNPSTPMVAAMMQIQDIFDGLEVAIKTERQKARNRADRSKGLPIKGVRPFGWEAQRMPLSAEKAAALGWTLSPAELVEGPFYVPAREPEAETIRAAYLAVVEDGVSLWELARRWTAAGVRTDKMGGTRKDRTRPGEVKNVPAVWVASTVRQVLIRPRNAGLLMSEGVELPISRIEPIVTREEWGTLRGELARRAEAIAPRPGPKPSYLLGGTLECACGERMHATISYSQRKDKKRHRYHVYKCRNMATDKAQRHSTIQLQLADDAVTLRVLKRVYEGDIGAVDRSEWAERMESLSDRLAENGRRTEHARTLLLDPDLKAEHARVKGELKALHAERDLIETERDGLQAQRAEGGALAELIAAWESIPESAKSAPGSDMPSWHEFILLTVGMSAWEAMPMAKRREIVRGLFRVRVELGGRGPERLKFTPVN